MARLDLTVAAGAFTTLIAVVVGVPVIMGVSASEEVTALPGWLWIASYALLLLAQIAVTWFGWAMRPRLTDAVYGAAVVLGPVVVIGAPGAGWLPILLVLTAAIGCYVVSGRTVVAIVLMNSATVGGAAWAHGGDTTGIAFSVLIYTVIQAATVMSITATLNEAETRTKLAVAHAELKAAAVALEETSRSAERLRIARDLHDAVGHQLTSLALELEVASHRPEEAAERVTRSRAIARDLLAEVRSVVGELRLRSPDLRTALDSMVQDVPDPQVRITVDETLLIDEERVLALVRCVQEVVTNAIRHSDARTLWITVRQDEDEVVLAARDDGAARGPVSPGNGLRSISERAAHLGGTSQFRADDGFHVEVRIPTT